MTNAEPEPAARLDERSLSKLKWRCRRGLLENDLFIERFFRRHEETITTRQACGLEALMDLADNDLLKVGRMCETAGVEVRFPFLDDDLVAFSAGIPGRVLLAGGDLRRFYKNAYRDFLAPETLNKEKQGFGLPTVEWMRQSADMSEMVREGVESFARRGYMRESYCRQVIESLMEGGSHLLSGSAYDILLLELWLQERGFRP